MNVSIKQFTNGLYLSTPPDASPDGTLRRARGLHPLSNLSVRSRNGSTLLHALNAHTISYFNDIWHMGVGGDLYRSDILVKSGLSGARLSLVRMPPTAGVVDYLFCCGGGALFKVDAAGSVTNWGLEPPATPTGGPIAGGALTAGIYKYQITNYSTVTGSRSDANGTDVPVTTVAANLIARLTGIPVSTDPQVSHVEIWRTEINGTLLFLLTRIANGITNFDDDGTTYTLSSTELPIDNLQPYSWFTMAAYWNASTFWVTEHAGDRGRLYYSPVGRCEAVQGYLNVTNDDDPLLGIFNWAGKLGVVSQSRAFEIIGTNPYQVRELSGVPGTNVARTVALTPYGILYEAADGIRAFTGTDAPLFAPDTIGRIFRGENVENLTSFIGLIATYARGEYFISDGTQTLAVNIEKRAWRDLGIGCNALHYEPEVDILAATVNGQVVDLEAEGTTTDVSAPIALSIEPAHIRADRETCIFAKRVLVDINDGAQALAITAIANGTEVALGSTAASSSRRINEFTLNRIVDRLGLRISGSLSNAVELFDITYVGDAIVLIVNIMVESATARVTMEIPGRLTDGGTTLHFDLISTKQSSLETLLKASAASSPLLSTRQYLIVERLFADINTNDTTLTAFIEVVGGILSIGTIQTSTRYAVDMPINKPDRLIELILEGDFSNIQLYRLEMDVYLSKGV